MINLIFPLDDPLADYDHDLQRMRRVLNEHGYDASRQDLYQAWLAYSESSAAGWMCLSDEDDYVVQTLMLYLVEPKDIPC